MSSSGVPLSVAYTKLDRSYNAWEEQKSRPDMLHQLWFPERERVCEKEEPKAETPLAAPASAASENKKPSSQKYSKTQILLVWVSIIALLIMVEFFVLRDGNK